MASTFKSVGLALTNAASNVYVCPANTTAVILICQISNKTAATNIPITVQWRDNSATTTYLLCNSIVIPYGTSLNALSGKLVLEANDYIQAFSNANSQAELSLSVMEIT